jgi:ribosomal protein S12 methylthiotransferase accessory factor
MRDAGMKLALYDVTWEVAVSCIVADLVAPDLPNVWGGWGCHTSPEVALSRALTEAAQSRLTYISGARDDLHPFREKVDLSKAFRGFAEPAAERRFEDLPARSTQSVAEDLQVVLESLERLGYEPYYVDLSRDEIGVPVVFAFVPGLRDAPYA